MKYILVIGAGSDIALPLEMMYAEAGFGLYLASRDIDRLKNDAESIKAKFSIEIGTYQFDVTATDSHRKFYTELPEKPFGIICLAGILGEQKVSEKDFREAQKVIDANYSGLVSIVHIAVEDLEQRKEGFIVGVSSVAGEKGRLSNYVYASAKAGFTAFLSGLRNRLHTSRVQVLTVHPGFIRTKMIEGRKTIGWITAQPYEVARDIFRAQQSGKDFIYSKWFWRYIMLVFKLIPESIVKRLDLR